MASILAFLSGLTPFIIQGGLWLISTFIKNQADKAQAQQDFMAAIQAHADDGLKSITLRSDAQAEADRLKQQQPPAQS